MIMSAVLSAGIILVMSSLRIATESPLRVQQRVHEDGNER